MTKPALRRRRPADSPGISELEEPLLGRDGDDVDTHVGASTRDRQADGAVVPYSINAHDWANLLRSIVTGAANGLRTLRATLRGCVSWWRTGPEPSYSAGQLAQREHLRHRISVPYNPECPQHQAALRQLWDAAFPGEQCTSLKTERWKDMGWQGTDPATDFRGAGFLALECHLYMASRHPQQFENLRYKRSGTRSEWEYPFAAGGVNLCFALLELLDLRDAHRVPATASGRAFVQLLGQGQMDSPKGQHQDYTSVTENGAAGGTSHVAPLQQRPPLKASQPDRQSASGSSTSVRERHDEAFEELYCAAYDALDRHWLAAQATYMDFPSVMRTTKEDVKAALSKANGSVQKTVSLLSKARS